MMLRCKKNHYHRLRPELANLLELGEPDERFFDPEILINSTTISLVNFADRQPNCPIELKTQAAMRRLNIPEADFEKAIYVAELEEICMAYARALNKEPPLIRGFDYVIAGRPDRVNRGLQTNLLSVSMPQIGIGCGHVPSVSPVTVSKTSTSPIPFISTAAPTVTTSATILTTASPVITTTSIIPSVVMNVIPVATMSSVAALSTALPVVCTSIATVTTSSVVVTSSGRRYDPRLRSARRMEPSPAYTTVAVPITTVSTTVPIMTPMVTRSSNRSDHQPNWMVNVTNQQAMAEYLRRGQERGSRQSRLIPHTWSSLEEMRRDLDTTTTESSDRMSTSSDSSIAALPALIDRRPDEMGYEVMQRPDTAQYKEQETRYQPYSRFRNFYKSQMVSQGRVIATVMPGYRKRTYEIPTCRAAVIAMNKQLSRYQYRLERHEDVQTKKDRKAAINRIQIRAWPFSHSDEYCHDYLLAFWSSFENQRRMIIYDGRLPQSICSKPVLKPQYQPIPHVDQEGDPLMKVIVTPWRASAFRFSKHAAKITFFLENNHRFPVAKPIEFTINVDDSFDRNTVVFGRDFAVRYIARIVHDTQTIVMKFDGREINVPCVHWVPPYCIHEIAEEVKKDPQNGSNAIYTPYV